MFPFRDGRPISLPDSRTFDQASLAEPLPAVIHASRRCGLAPSQTILVYGVGAIGLLVCALAKHTDASKVYAIDINPVRLQPPQLQATTAILGVSTLSAHGQSTRNVSNHRDNSLV